jgi:hypothetical protein
MTARRNPPHRDRHPQFVDGCFGCKALTIQLTPSAAPTSADATLAAGLREEKTLDEDGSAYVRLRRDGYQPKHINGSAQLEAEAETRYEIESGQLFTGRAQQGMRDAVKQFEDLTERSVFEPVVTPRTGPPLDAA